MSRTAGKRQPGALDVAVVAHCRKSFGGGLPELRKILAREGVTDPLWHEVNKSRHAPEYARRAAAQGVDVLFVWGGDGTVQRCIDAVAGMDTAVAILPAGTANLLGTNLQIPDDLTQAVRIGLHGDRRWLDTGSVNGEHFTVMAGAGFDARMISDGGARPARKDMRIKARPGSITICVPAKTGAVSAATTGGSKREPSHRG
jgi:diacylglycerol kinase (ATP)